MLATLVIVFREVFEAGLIVGIVLSATRGMARRGLWISYGVVGGALGACVVAAFAGQIAALFEGAGQELFTATILILAVVMLSWHNAWMARHGRALALEIRRVGAAVAAGDRPPAALAVVCGVAVLREGSEVVLFLYGIAASGGSSAPGMITGGVLGLALGMLVSLVMYLGLLTIPARYLFSVTSTLITLLAAGLAAQAVAFVQQAGYVERLVGTAWNSSWLVSDDSLIGRLLRSLVGYTAEPSWAQLLVYILTIGSIIGLMRIARRSDDIRTPPLRSSLPVSTK